MGVCIGLITFFFPPALFNIILRIFTKRKSENVTDMLEPDHS